MLIFYEVAILLAIDPIWYYLSFGDVARFFIPKYARARRVLVRILTITTVPLNQYPSRWQCYQFRFMFNKFDFDVNYYTDPNESWREKKLMNDVKMAIVLKNPFPAQSFESVFNCEILSFVYVLLLSFWSQNAKWFQNCLLVLFFFSLSRPNVRSVKQCCSSTCIFIVCSQFSSWKYVFIQAHHSLSLGCIIRYTWIMRATKNVHIKYTPFYWVTGKMLSTSLLLSPLMWLYRFTWSCCFARFILDAITFGSS